MVQENPLLELDDHIEQRCAEYLGALEIGVEPLSVDLMEIPEEAVASCLPRRVRTHEKADG